MGKNSVNALTQNYTLCLNSFGIYDFKLCLAMYSCACSSFEVFLYGSQVHSSYPTHFTKNCNDERFLMSFKNLWFLTSSTR